MLTLDQKEAQVLITASAKIKTKVKKNRVKRVIRSCLDLILEKERETKIKPAAVAFVGGESFVQKKHRERIEIMDQILKKAEII